MHSLEHELTDGNASELSEVACAQRSIECITASGVVRENGSDKMAVSSLSSKNVADTSPRSRIRDLNGRAALPCDQRPIADSSVNEKRSLM